MLPSELARFKIEGEKVFPIFATDEDIEVAEEVINTFRIGKKIIDILDDIKYLSKIYDHKLVKGLAKTFLKYCKVESESKIDYRELRRQLFIRGPVINEEERVKAIEEVKQMFHLDPIKLMYGDLEEERRIIEVAQLSPNDLLKVYNLSLLQTIIFNAYKMTVIMNEGWKDLVRRIKMLGLMYLAYENPLRIEIFGPLTLVKMTEKYGRNLAALIPYIVFKKEWKIIADIVIGKKKRTYRMELSNSSHLFKYIKDEEVEKRFDSSIEERFYNDFKKVIRDWQIIREPEPFVIEKRFYFPDFVLIRGDTRVYVEIMGFWTKEYISSKIEKLKHFNYPILILLNEELSYDNYIPDNFNIIKFKKKVDIGKVYLYLKSFVSQENHDIDLGSLKEDIISIKDLSKKYNTDEKIIREKLANYKDYIVMKNYAIKRSLLEELAKCDFSNKSLTDLINNYGNYILDVLEYLGYKIIWKNISEALVQKVREV